MQGVGALGSFSPDQPQSRDHSHLPLLVSAPHWIVHGLDPREPRFNSERAVIALKDNGQL